MRPLIAHAHGTGDCEEDPQGHLRGVEAQKYCLDQLYLCTHLLFFSQRARPHQPGLASNLQHPKAQKVLQSLLQKEGAVGKIFQKKRGLLKISANP